MNTGVLPGGYALKSAAIRMIVHLRHNRYL